VYEDYKVRDREELNNICKQQNLRIASEKLRHTDFKLQINLPRAQLTSVQRILRTVCARQPITAADHDYLFELIQNHAFKGEVNKLNSILRSYQNLAEIELDGVYTYEPAYTAAVVAPQISELKTRELNSEQKECHDLLEDLYGDLEDALIHSNRIPHGTIQTFVANAIRFAIPHHGNVHHPGQMTANARERSVHALEKYYAEKHSLEPFEMILDWFEHSPSNFNGFQRLIRDIESKTRVDESKDSGIMIYGFSGLERLTKRDIQDIKKHAAHYGKFTLSQLEEKINELINKDIRDESNITGINWQVKTTGVFTIFGCSARTPMNNLGVCVITNNSRFITNQHVFDSLNSGDNPQFFVVEGLSSGKHIARSVDIKTREDHDKKDLSRFAVLPTPYLFECREDNGVKKWCVDQWVGMPHDANWFFASRHYECAVPKLGDPICKVTPIWDGFDFKGNHTGYGAVGDSDGVNFLHKIDTEPGHSGSPLLNKHGKIVGIHKGSYSHGLVNRAVAVDLQVVVAIHGNQSFVQTAKSKNSKPQLPQ